MCHTEVPAGSVTPEVHHEHVRIPLVRGEAMPAVQYSPIGGSGAKVLVIADMYGPSPFYQHLCARLAAAGFTALLPDYFFRQGPLEAVRGDLAMARRSNLDELGMLKDMDQTVGWLGAGHDRGRVGVIGFCMGGTIALDLASTRKDLVTVSYYGFPVPQATIKMPPPRPLDLVTSLHGPVLGFWGENDEVVGVSHASQYAQQAAAVNPSFAAEFVADAGHGFLGDAELDSSSDPQAATWVRTLEHLAAHLL